ncbi:MAG: hypothetical protein IIY87_02930 [Bacteroidales bacterium]|nr:hypothetical protein [Bacteroidales bacterium]
MKRTITLCLAIMIAFAASAQKNTTKFLGIPVDGTKSAMIQKLKAKGFNYDATNDVLSGEFNGRDVNLHVVTNNNKVYRIMVSDATGSSEGDIRIRFNTLCRQFKKNGKYIPQDFVGEYSIGEDVDISYEMTVDNKRFEAAYYQVSEADQDTTGLADWAIDKIVEKYGEEGYQNLSEEEAAQAQLFLIMEYIREKISHKSVWMMISSNFGRYYINIYYDNELNHADGEDL